MVVWNKTRAVSSQVRHLPSWDSTRTRAQPPLHSGQLLSAPSCARDVRLPRRVQVAELLG